MPRIARAVVPGVFHRVTRRGSRRMEAFPRRAGCDACIDLTAERRGRHGVKVWAHCPMPEHVRQIVVPKDKGSLARAPSARRAGGIPEW